MNKYAYKQDRNLCPAFAGSNYSLNICAAEYVYTRIRILAEGTTYKSIS